jgi:hypothetical protein
MTDLLSLWMVLSYPILRKDGVKAVLMGIKTALKIGAHGPPIDPDTNRNGERRIFLRFSPALFSI